MKAAKSYYQKRVALTNNAVYIHDFRASSSHYKNRERAY